VKLEPPVNKNYAATVVRVSHVVQLDGLDNLVGVPVLGHQALTQKGKVVGDVLGQLRIAFTAETQLSHEYASQNNLYREAELNADPEQTGYLEKNRRIRAIKLRGHRSNALLMPLSSVAFTGIDPNELQEGDTFDTLNGVEICRKYEIPRKKPSRQQSKVEKAFKRVDRKLFPEHLDTDAYWRSKDLLKAGREVIVTQKLHGTSIRVGRVPCLRQKGRIERFLNRWFPTADFEYDAVYGSRKVIKDPNNPYQNHHYGTDLWSEYGQGIADLIPEGYIVYGELIGWTKNAEGQIIPIQKNYTYNLPKGECELYVYRVATINAQGTLADLSWDGVKQFCEERGLKWTPEMFRVQPWELDSMYIEALMDKRYADDGNLQTKDQMVPLSDPKTVDEGVCLRQEGIVPVILKAKSPQFLEHETKLLDKGEEDLESAA